MIIIKSDNTLIKNNLKYTINFDYLQNYEIKLNSIHILAEEDKKYILELLSSKSKKLNLFNLNSDIANDILTYELSSLDIKNITILYDENQKKYKASREFLITLIISIYDLDKLNNILKSLNIKTIQNNYNNEIIESEEICNIFSKLFTGIYVQEKNKTFDILLENEKTNFSIINKLIVQPK